MLLLSRIGSFPPASIIATSRRNAPCVISSTGCRIVVSPGVIMVLKSKSSNPTMDMSLGTRTPSIWANL